MSTGFQVDQEKEKQESMVTNLLEIYIREGIKALPYHQCDKAVQVPRYIAPGKKRLQRRQNGEVCQYPD